MSKEVKIDAKLNGAERVEAGLKSIGQTAREAGEKVDQGGQRAKGGLDDVSKGTKEAVLNVENMVLAFGKMGTALHGVIALYQELISRVREANAEMTETMEMSSNFTNDISGVQHMLGNFDPEVRSKIGGYAIEGERSLKETATAYYNLISSAGDMTKDQQHKVFMEALELGRTEPDTPLDQIVSAMTLYSQKTGNFEANSVQNLLKTTLKNAKTDMSGIASYMPRFLPNALAAGLTGPEALGTWATASLALNSPDLATTSLDSFFSGLEGKGTPESKRLLSKYGVSDNDDYFTKISKLSEANSRGEIGYSEMATIAGGPGAAVMKSFLDNPQLLMRNVQEMNQINLAQRLDITAKELHQKTTIDPLAKYESMRKRAVIEEEWYRANDLETAQLSAAEAIYRAASAKKGEAPSEADRLIEHNRVARRLGPIGEALDPFGLYHIPELMTREQVSKYPKNEPTIINNNYYGNHYLGPNPAPAPVVGPDAAQ